MMAGTAAVVVEVNSPLGRLAAGGALEEIVERLAGHDIEASPIETQSFGRSTVVRDPDGLPIPGAAVTLSWRYSLGALVSRSSRRTDTGANGEFRFSDLGPGVHALSVAARGFEAAWLTHDPEIDGSPVSVALQSLDQPATDTR